MKITVGQTFSETAETFLINPQGAQWHLCRYPEQPGVWRCRPGPSCETPCEAISISTAAAVQAAAEPPAVAELAPVAASAPAQVVTEPTTPPEFMPAPAEPEPEPEHPIKPRHGKHK